MINKKQEKEFIEKNFSKAVGIAKTCIQKGIDVSNVLIILKRDFSTEYKDIGDKDVKEIRDLLPNLDMLCYIYILLCKATNKYTKKQRIIVSIGVCKSDFYKRIDIEFKDKKIIDEKVIKERNKKEEVDVLDLWGNFETITIKDE